MAEVKKGFVAKIFPKEGKKKDGKKWFLNSFKLVDENGTEDPMFYSLGFNVPCKFAEGDYIQFKAEASDRDTQMDVVKGSGSKPKNPPARKAGKKPSNAASTEKNSELFGSIGGYNTEDDIKRMSITAARSSAVELVSAMLEHDALPMSKAKNGQAKRYDEIVAFVDKLTVKFFFDTASGRILELVADEGKVDVAKNDLPDQDDNSDPVEKEDDAIPLDDDDTPEDDDDDGF